MKIDIDRIDKIHSNKIGIAFFDKSEIENIDFEQDIYLLFNNTILIFNIFELEIFFQDVINTMNNVSESSKGKHSKYYKCIILETPLHQLRLVSSYNDLQLLKDLIKGTLFQIELSGILKEIL
ncbi:hypothetical protein [Tenacibaculum sp. nBUS_03]|uniref:hypothetical protein n=1 Tax=Tenacibaculum sp. nBUS_03 TaxID=3395320 RepID=UPI003EB78051